MKHLGERKDSLINDVGRFICFLKKNRYICHHEPNINNSSIRELSRKYNQWKLVKGRPCDFSDNFLNFKVIKNYIGNIPL